MSFSKLTPRISSIGRKKFLRYLRDLRDQVRRSSIAMFVIASMMPARDLLIPGLRDVFGVSAAFHARVRRLEKATSLDKKCELAQINRLLIAAAGRGLTDIVKFLLDAGVDVNYFDHYLWRSCLHNAILNGHTDTVRLLLDAGADPNQRYGKRPLRSWGNFGVQSRTPLHLAAMKGNAEMVKLLLDAGADPEDLDESFRKPIHAAMWMGHNDVVPLLT